MILKGNDPSKVIVFSCKSLFNKFISRLNLLYDRKFVVDYNNIPHCVFVDSLYDETWYLHDYFGTIYFFFYIHIVFLFYLYLPFLYLLFLSPKKRAENIVPKIISNIVEQMLFLLTNLANKSIQDRREKKGFIFRSGQSILSHSWFWLYTYFYSLAKLTDRRVIMNFMFFISNFTH